MILIIIFGIPVASIIFYVSTMGILEKIKKNEETIVNICLGSLSFAFIMFSLVYSILVGAN
ncbi:hypothetical protein HYG86_14560 [Alkalicella caledoniensis]|uniref:Uncharacterized protein n=1 Tax=Alkalicella caledoniensis TaxID=2731377 RepID=A0A7G9WB42_ALKCA|nr:hypothetical protein [Alkalicella caledoniensis]QNO15904.1 hypothetical protein HYG86_14560 [Alkalicella caledoniensis]